MKKLIINADDFGYCKGVNYGIIEAHADGVLTSTTMMANMPGFHHAVELRQQHPNLGIGVHLNLTTGSPVLKHLKTIVDTEGNFHSQAYYKGSFIIDQKEVYDEWKAQIEKTLAAGIQPTHSMRIIMRTFLATLTTSTSSWLMNTICRSETTSTIKIQPEELQIGSYILLKLLFNQKIL